jgi:hypothetical protein
MNLSRLLSVPGLSLFGGRETRGEFLVLPESEVNRYKVNSE